jgi:hypothetical protein
MSHFIIENIRHSHSLAVTAQSYRGVNIRKAIKPLSYKGNLTMPR